jgi:hypothetical protein
MASIVICGISHFTLPKMEANAQSAASRPVARRMKPMGIAVPEGSNMYQRLPT